MKADSYGKTITATASIGILVVTPDAFDATSLYRAVGPLSALRKQHPQLSMHFDVDLTWASMAMTDIVFLQRPYSERHLDIVQTARDYGKKIWLDYDDDLFSVPPGHPAYKHYSSPLIQANIAKLVRDADAVSVSVPYLKDRLEDGGHLRADRMPCRVIPNAFDDGLFGWRRKINPIRTKSILWRGSRTHRDDLLAFSEQILAGARKHHDWTWHFRGDNPEFLKDASLPNLLFWPPVEPARYFRAIYELGPAVAIVPLVDDDLNRSKSNIAWIEAAFAGGIALAPDWDEWKRPGCINYSDPQDFAIKLEGILSGQVDIDRESASGWEYIRANLLLPDVNRMRMQLISDLLQTKSTT